MPTLELIDLVEPATVTSGGATAPSPGTVETWDFTGTLPAIGTNEQFRLIDESDRGDVAGYEVVLATANASGALTVTRGAEGTAPKAHTSGFKIIPVITPAVFDGRYVNAESGGFTIGAVDFFTGLTDSNPLLSVSSSGIASAQSPSSAPVSTGFVSLVGQAATNEPILYMKDSSASTSGIPMLLVADHSANPIAWLNNSGGFGIVDNVSSANSQFGTPPITIGRSGGTGYGWPMVLNNLASPVVTPSLGSGGTLGASTEYFYTVIARRADGAKGVGIEVNDTTGTSNKTIVLTWAHIPGANDYLIYRSTISGTYGSTALVGSVLDSSSSGANVTFSDNGITLTTGAPPAASAAGGFVMVDVNANTSAPTGFGFIGHAGIGLSYDTLNGLRLNGDGAQLKIPPSGLGQLSDFTTTSAGSPGDASTALASDGFVVSEIEYKALRNSGTVHVMAFGADNTFSPSNLSAGVSTTAFQNAYAALPTRSFPAYNFTSKVWSSITAPIGRFELASGGYNLDTNWHGENYDFGPFVEVTCSGGRGSCVIYYTGGGNHVVLQATNPFNGGPTSVGDNTTSPTSPQGTGTNPFYGMQKDTAAGAIKNITIDGSLMTVPVGWPTNQINSAGIHTNTPIAVLAAGGESFHLDVVVRNWNFPTYGQAIGVVIQSWNTTGGISGNWSSWMESGRYEIFTINCDVHVAFIGKGTGTTSTSFNNTEANIRLNVYPGQMAVVIDSGALLYHSHLAINGGFNAQMPISRVAVDVGSYSPTVSLDAYSAYPIPAYYNGAMITVGSITGIITGAVEGGTGGSVSTSLIPSGFGYLFGIQVLSQVGSTNAWAVATGSLGSIQSATMVSVFPAGPPTSSGGAYIPRTYGLALVELGLNGGGTAAPSILKSGTLEMFCELDSNFMSKNTITTSVLSAGTTYSTSNPIPIGESGGGAPKHGILAGMSFTISGDPNNNVFVCAATAAAGATSVEVESITPASNIPSGGALTQNIIAGGTPGTIFIDDSNGCFIDTGGHLDFTGGGINFHGIRLSSGSFAGNGFTFTGIVAGDTTLSTSGAEVFLKMHTQITAPVGTPH